MKIIETNKAPKAIGPYSQAIEAGGLTGYHLKCNTRKKTEDNMGNIV